MKKCQYPALLIACILWIGVVTSTDPSVSFVGDWTLGGLFSVETNDGGGCGDIYTESIQTYQAVVWFLKKLNDRNYIPGIRLGFKAFKTCDDPSKAVKATLDLLQEFADHKLYGIIGPEISSETRDVSHLLSSLPEEDRLIQISFSATAATLSNKSIYKNLFRVIEADDVQVDVLHQLLIKMKWNYIAIVYEKDQYGIEGATALRRLAEESDICVPVFHGIAPDASTEERRLAFASLAELLERASESPIVGLVFFGYGTTAQSMFSYLNIQLQTFQVVASEAISLNKAYMKNSIGTIYPRAKGLITLSPPVNVPLNFQDYWTRIHSNSSDMIEAIQNNNWLLKYMESITACQLDNVVSIDPTCIRNAERVSNSVSIYINYVLMAVAAIASTLQELHTSMCFGIAGTCPAMENLKRSLIIEKMSSVRVNLATEFTDIFTSNFTYAFINGEIMFPNSPGVPLYSVYNYRYCDTAYCFTKVGNFLPTGLELEGEIWSYDKDGVKSASPVEAQCQPSYSCTSCTVSAIKGKVMFVPGDFYIVGLVPIHDKGDKPMECGALRTSLSVEIAEAIRFATMRVNMKKEPFVNILGSKTIGIVLIDTCNNALVARERVIQLNRGELELTGGILSSSILDKIIGYVGPYGSALSVPLSSVMTEIDKLFISYASTSTSLSSRTVHPNFMRTCSPDYKQAMFIMHLAKELNSQYVQIIYTDEEYGRAGLLSLTKAAKQYEICIAQSIPIKDSTDRSNFIGYVSELRRHRHAKVVIIFVRSHVTALLMEVLSVEMITNEFVFLGGESWGNREAVLNNNPALLGSLSLSQELPRDHRFNDYFTGIDVPKSVNPWLQEYVELRSGCYYPLSFNKGNTKIMCTYSSLAQHGQLDPWVPFAMNAVYAMILGFNEALHETCLGTFSMCPEYQTSDLIKHTKNVKLDIGNNGAKIRVFDSNGEGDTGYYLYHVVRVENNIIYKQLGSSTPEGFQILQSKLGAEKGFESSCQNDVDCGVCKLQFNVTVVSPVVGTNSATIGLGVFIAILLLVIAALVVLGFLFWRRQRNTLTKNTEKTVVHKTSNKADMEEDYLHAIAGIQDSEQYSDPMPDGNRYDYIAKDGNLELSSDYISPREDSAGERVAPIPAPRGQYSNGSTDNRSSTGGEYLKQQSS